MALISTVDCIYVFDFYARNNFGMPDSNDTAVVMKCADVSELEQYLCFFFPSVGIKCLTFLNFFNTNIITIMNTGQFSTLSP